MSARQVVEVAAVLGRLLEPVEGQVWVERPQTVVAVAAAVVVAASAVVAVAAVVEVVSERLVAAVAESA